jgi:hypothetical protein
MVFYRVMLDVPRRWPGGLWCPVGHLPGTAQIVPFGVTVRSAQLGLAGLVDRLDCQAAATADAGGLVQPGDGGPAYHFSSPRRRPRPRAEQLLYPVWVPVPGPLDSVQPSVSADRSSARRRTCPPAAAMAHPGETRTQQFQHHTSSAMSSSAPSASSASTAPWRPGTTSDYVWRGTVDVASIRIWLRHPVPP